MSGLLKYADSLKLKVDSISLGQGQGPKVWPQQSVPGYITTQLVLLSAASMCACQTNCTA